MFNLLLRILPDIKLPSQDTVEDKALRKEIGIQESDAQVISRWLGLVLLLRIPAGDKVSQEKVEAFNAMQASDLEFLQPWSLEMELPYRQNSLTKTPLTPMFLALEPISSRSSTLTWKMKRLHAGSGTDTTLQPFAYEIIGILSKASRFTFQQKLSLAQWLFQSLSEETIPETVVDIEGALSMLST
ncbi:Proteasome-associated protein ECM29 -like protein [Ceratocystis lukuohia]|uniref:Proteasome-associated protein ECM29 -like protein n=1 Tax=Ceratocystis lukuohia TaxID=2019550 RepID=A0ABR4MG61_9PEZI